MTAAVVPFPGDLREQDRLPHNLEAEQAVIGALLYDNETLEALPPGMAGHRFHEPYHGRLYDAVCAIVRAGRLADPTLVADRMQSDPAFSQIGGLTFLVDLVDRAPATFVAAEYARSVMDLALRRDLIRRAGDIIKSASDPEATALDRLKEAERGLGELSESAPLHSAWHHADVLTGDAITAARERAGAIELPFGLTELDAVTGGLHRGEVTIIAGRPAMGKSSAGLTVARSLASIGKGVAFFSMEMPKTPLGLRMACDMAWSPGAPVYSGESRNPSFFKASRGELDADQWRELEQARQRMAGWPLLFDVRPGLTVSTMESCVRRAIRDWERQGVEPGAIILDHLTIARAEQDRKGNKVAEVGDISRGLAEMAKRLDIPVVALCQLSRAVESRGVIDKRPSLADLRWSGEIEQDARTVIMLYRPEYYVRPPEDDTDYEAAVEHRAKLDKVRNKLFWLVEKQNNGPVCQVETYCEIASSAIRDRRGDR